MQEVLTLELQYRLYNVLSRHAKGVHIVYRNYEYHKSAEYIVYNINLNTSPPTVKQTQKMTIKAWTHSSGYLTSGDKKASKYFDHLNYQN